MEVIYWVFGIITIALLAYLILALIKPEIFS